MMTAFITGTTFASGYVVKPRETLSEIAHKTIPGPVWGSQGSLKKILALNSEIKDSNFIYPNDVLEVSEQSNLPRAENIPATPDKNTASHVISENSDTLKQERNLASDVSTSTDPFKRHTYLSLAPIFEFSRLDSTDRATGGKAAFSSDLNLGVSFAYTQVWSESFQTDLSLAAKSVRFQTSDSGATLTHNGLFLGALDLHAHMGESQHIQFLGQLVVNQTPFLRSTSLTALTFDTVAVPHVGAGVALPLVNLDPLQLSFEFGADYLAPGQTGSNYTINSGYEISPRLKLMEFESGKTSKGITAELYFNYFKQDTSISTQTYKELGARIIFSFDYFHRSHKENNHEGEKK